MPSCPLNSSQYYISQAAVLHLSNNSRHYITQTAICITSLKQQSALHQTAVSITSLKQQCYITQTAVSITSLKQQCYITQTAVGITSLTQQCYITQTAVGITSLTQQSALHHPNSSQRYITQTAICYTTQIAVSVTSPKQWSALHHSAVSITSNSSQYNITQTAVILQVVMCRVRFRFLGNLLSQLVHTNLTMPRWTKSRCSCMVRSRLKDLWHTGHSKGLKPVWVIMCRCRSFFSGNLLPQSCTHTYTHTQLEENLTDGNHQLSNAMHMKLYFITLHMLH